MTTRPYLFHIIAAVAFLTATPMLAMGTAQLFLPSLHFIEDNEQPTRTTTTHTSVPKAQK